MQTNLTSPLILPPWHLDLPAIEIVGEDPVCLARAGKMWPPKPSTDIPLNFATSTSQSLKRQSPEQCSLKLAGRDCMKDPKP